MLNRVPIRRIRYVHIPHARIGYFLSMGCCRPLPGEGEELMSKLVTNPNRGCEIRLSVYYLEAGKQKLLTDTLNARRILYGFPGQLAEVDCPRCGHCKLGL